MYYRKNTKRQNNVMKKQNYLSKIVIEKENMKLMSIVEIYITVVIKIQIKEAMNI